MAPLFSQNSTINFSYFDKPLKVALDSLVSVHGLNIVYRDQLVNNININAMCKDCTGDDAMNSLLKDTSLDWEINKSQYIVININTSKSISGYIIDGNTGEYIPHASIYVKDTYLGTMSDEYGFFNLAKNINLNDTLIISYIGYEPLKVTNNINDDIVYFEITPKIIGVETINIFGEKIEFLQRSQNFGELAFSPRHIKNLPNIGESDIFRSLQLLPGIQMGNTGFAGLYVRGGTPDQNHIILDGMTIYQIDHFFGFFSSINSNIVKDIQIYRSGFPAKYGGGISSIIDITGKSGSSKKKKLDLFTNMLSAGFTYQQPLFKKGSFILAARRSFTDKYQTKLYDSISDFLTSGSGLNIGDLPSDTISYNSEYLPNFYFYDINGKFTYLPTKRNIISISFYEGKDYLGEEKNFDFPLDPIGVDQVIVNEKTRWGNSGVSIKLLHRWSGKATTQLFYSNTRYLSNHLLNSYWNLDNITSPVYLSKDENQIKDQTFRVNNSYSTNQYHSIETGVSKTIYETDYSVELGDSVIFIDESINGNLFEAYVQDRWATSDIEILFGIRLEKFRKNNENYFDPRLVASYRLTNNFSIKLSGSRTHQYLNRFSNDLITNGSKFVWLIPNNYMKPMSSIQKNFGVEYDTPDVFFSLGIYNKTLENISDFSQLVFPVDIYSEISNDLIFQGEGEAHGGEFFFQKKSGLFRGWASYSYGIIEYKFPELNGGDIFLADHDRTHEFKSTLISSFGKWTFSITGLLSSGRVYTSKDNLMIRQNENANYTLEAAPGTRNRERLPLVQRIDLSLNRSMYFMEKNLDVGISIFNVFDRYNISHRSYNLSVDPFIATDIIMLGFTPTISMQLRL